MILFWIVAVALIAAALLLLLPVLFNKNGTAETVERRQVNITVHRDKLAELERDLASGVLNQDQYDAAKKEIELALLEDLGDDDADVGEVLDEPRQRIYARIGMVAVAVIVPVLSLAMYGALGGGSAAFAPDQAVPQVAAEGHEGPLEGMVAGLLQRLEKDPNDAEGWLMLGRSYYFLKQHGKAAEALGKAVGILGEDNPDLLADYADTLAVANNRSMAGKPYELVKKALSLQPFHEKSLWLAGTGAYQQGDFQSAYQYWEKLLQIFPPGSENATQIQRNLGELKTLMAQQGIAVPESSGEAVAVASAPAVAATGLSGNSVSGTVKLVPALAAGAAPEDTLFVFARAASGPRMPLAILRKQVKDLPVEFTLDDSLAMNPAMKLSNFPEVVVGARISKSGNAMPQSGDLQGLSEVVSVGTTEIPVLINTVVP